MMETITLKRGQVWRSGLVHARIVSVHKRPRRIRFTVRNGKVGRYRKRVQDMKSIVFLNMFCHLVKK